MQRHGLTFDEAIVISTAAHWPYSSYGSIRAAALAKASHENGLLSLSPCAPGMRIAVVRLDAKTYVALLHRTFVDGMERADDLIGRKTIINQSSDRESILLNFAKKTYKVTRLVPKVGASGVPHTLPRDNAGAGARVEKFFYKERRSNRGKADLERMEVNPFEVQWEFGYVGPHGENIIALKQESIAYFSSIPMPRRCMANQRDVPGLDKYFRPAFTLDGSVAISDKGPRLPETLPVYQTTQLSNKFMQAARNALYTVIRTNIRDRVDVSESLFEPPPNFREVKR